ncbi:hypothetical protein ACH4LK_04540 [Streptomyces lydicus]|uniref:hypothetical protein n=1 Tax=Streptomyces lydicus TaxID=47763 RepID=UPI0037A509EB
MSTVRKCRLSIAALDASANLAVVGALIVTTLVMYRGGAGIFPGGNEGRVVFAALTAALVAYGLNSTLENLVGPTREGFEVVLREELTEAALVAAQRYRAAAAQDAPETAALRAVALRAETKALGAGADFDGCF